MSTPVIVGPVPPAAVDSTTQGFLAPVNTYGSLDDQALARFIQPMVAGITGLDPILARAAWQPEPPDEPDFGVDWCLVRLENREPDTFSWEGSYLEGSAVIHGVIRHELLNFRAAFQGPNSEAMTERFSLGLALAQNREYLTQQGYGLVETGKPIIIPVLRNERWLYTVDLPFTLRRRQQVAYTVKPLIAAGVELIVDQPAYTKNFKVQES